MHQGTSIDNYPELSFFNSKRRLILFVVSIVLVGTLYAFVVTHGTFDLFQREALSSTYTSMLDHLKRGSFEVDLEANISMPTQTKENLV